MKAASEIQIALKLLDTKFNAKTDLQDFVKMMSVFIRWHSIIRQLSIFVSPKSFSEIFTINQNNAFFCSIFFRLITDFSQLFQPIFMAAFAWSTISICGAMCLVQLEIV